MDSMLDARPSLPETFWNASAPVHEQEGTVSFPSQSLALSAAAQYILVFWPKDTSQVPSGKGQTQIISSTNSADDSQPPQPTPNPIHPRILSLSFYVNMWQKTQSIRHRKEDPCSTEADNLNEKISSQDRE